MLSRMDAFARPVRTVASSLRKSSTAFSMRVRAAAVASLVEPIVDMVSIPQSAFADAFIRSKKRSPRRAKTCLSHRDFGTDAISENHALDVPVLVHVENHD